MNENNSSTIFNIKDDNIPSYVLSNEFEEIIKVQMVKSFSIIFRSIMKIL